MADSPTPGYSGATLLVVALGSAVVGALAGWALAEATSRPSSPARTRSKGSAGYYVLLYNYPRGDRSRRLKGWAGPYATRGQADAKADQEKDVWYPSVRKLSADPRALGM